MAIKTEQNMLEAHFLLGGESRDLDLHFGVQNITVVLQHNSLWVLKDGQP